MLHLLQVFFNSAKREGIFLIKNPWDFAVMFWIPTLTVFLVWWIFSRSVITDVPIAVINHSHGQASATLIRYLDASPDIAVVEKLPSENSIKNKILTRKIYGAIVIPYDFDKKLLQGKNSQVLLQVNAQYGTHSGIIQRGVQQSVGTLSAGIEIKSLIKKGNSLEQAKIAYSPIQMQRISLFNDNSNYQLFLASTVLPALLHILAMTIGATTVGREVRDKTLDKWFEKVTEKKVINKKEEYKKYPLTPYHFLTLVAGLNGKFIWSMLAYTLWGAVCLTLASQLHPSSVQAWSLTYFTFLLLMMVSFWMGGIFTLLSFSLRKGLSATGFISAPSFAFAGVTYPFIALSSGAKKWALALPLTHYLNLHIAQLQMDAPISVSINIVYGFMLAVMVLMFLCVLLTHRALNNPQRWGQR
ncbi:MAG: ABC transporter permease [Moraxellaceae bacterium]|nr:ABC transporter permease [Moraxellaceae bacterium]